MALNQGAGANCAPSSMLIWAIPAGDVSSIGIDDGRVFGRQTVRHRLGQIQSLTGKVTDRCHAPAIRRRSSGARGEPVAHLERDQVISSAATAWAAMPLAQTLPVQA